MILSPAPEYDPDNSGHHDGRGDQNPRKGRLRRRDRGGNKLGDQPRFAPGGGNDIACIEGILDRIRNRLFIQLDRKDVLPYEDVAFLQGYGWT